MATEAAAPYIETLLKRVAARGPSMGIRFEAGAPVRVSDASGSIRDVTNRALSPQEIMSAIAPIVPEDMKREVAQQPTATFDYVCPDVGTFTVVIRRDGDQIAVSIDPAGSASANPTTPAPQVAEPAFGWKRPQSGRRSSEQPNPRWRRPERRCPPRPRRRRPSPGSRRS